ncbi:ubiquitin-like small modifier protein 1 [Natrialbaceae archaeon GCM10025810]|uniref:ubiquitin-like small modifier protein 1 n=1 Tax=Halovalidus salilacus TaxID=3075124 RepID=UPI00362024F6
MEIDCRFFATFREAVGQKERTYTVEDDATVGDLLAFLEDEYEGLDGQLLENGGVRPQLNVLVNGRNVVHEEGTETELEEGDVLSVFPPVAGG